MTYPTQLDAVAATGPVPAAGAVVAGFLLAYASVLAGDGLLRAGGARAGRAGYGTAVAEVATALGVLSLGAFAARRFGADTGAVASLSVPGLATLGAALGLAVASPRLVRALSGRSPETPRGAGAAAPPERGPTPTGRRALHASGRPFGGSDVSVPPPLSAGVAGAIVAARLPGGLDAGGGFLVGFAGCALLFLVMSWTLARVR